MNRNHPKPVEPATARRSQRAGFTLTEFFTVLGILALAVMLLFTASRGGGGAREAARRSQCRNNLKQIGRALHNYEETYGALPPAFTVDAHPLHSWRTLILPFLDGKELYEKIDLSKPWNDPANAEAFKASPDGYFCPSLRDTEPTHTTYSALVGDDCCFRPAASRQVSEITDDPADTMMVIEVDEKHSVHWMSPEDTGLQFLTSLGEKTESTHTGGTHVIFVDLRVYFLRSNMSAADRKAMTTIAGGDRVSDDAK